MVSVRDLELFVAGGEKLLCSPHHIKESAPGKTIWLQGNLFNQDFNLSMALCQGKWAGEKEKVALSPCHRLPLHSWLDFQAEEGRCRGIQKETQYKS